MRSCVSMKATFRKLNAVWSKVKMEDTEVDKLGSLLNWNPLASGSESITFVMSVDEYRRFVPLLRSSFMAVE